MLTCPICSWAFDECKCKAVPYPAQSSTTVKNKPKLIVFCENCSAGIAVPLIASVELERFYVEGDYWDHSGMKLFSPKAFPVPYALSVSRWELIEPLFEKREGAVSLLDVGAGQGFLGMAAAKSPRLHLRKYACVEKDKALVESLRKTWLVRFPHYALAIESHIDLVQGEFDCIVFSHVLEHQVNPKELLVSAVGRLAPGGFVFIDVPNQDYLFKGDVFPHTLFFTTASLQILLEGCGLTVNRLGCYGRSMKRSPMNCRNLPRVHKLITAMVTVIKAAIPQNLLLSFFTWYFGMNKESEDGTWIRAVAQHAAVKS